MDYNYDTLKQIAAENKLRVTDLLALAPQNDPFYTGRPAEIDAAQWFFILFQRFGYTTGVHLRRIHYQIVSQNPPVAMPNGEVYENTERCWDFLNNAAKWARYMELVPASRFVDRRNPDAIIHARFYSPDHWMYHDPTPGIAITESDNLWDAYQVPDLPTLPELPATVPDFPRLFPVGYEGVQQDYLIEIWSEKTTMNDVLIPLCQQYGVNLVTGAGELSVTAVIQFIKRIEAADKPARILYISDFDPAGLGMPISVARKIEYYLRKMDGAPDVKLDPIVLNPDQIERYNLPRVPVKDSDRRKSNFENAYGQGQVELDALEALYPGELGKIVRLAILNYYDDHLEDRAWTTRSELSWRLDDERGKVLKENADEIATLEKMYRVILDGYAQTRTEFSELTRAFQPKLDTYVTHMKELRSRGWELYNEIRKQLETVDVDLTDYDLPEPDLPKEPQGQLYESWRSYIEQLRYYKNHRNNVEQLPLREAIE